MGAGARYGIFRNVDEAIPGPAVDCRGPRFDHIRCERGDGAFPVSRHEGIAFCVWAGPAH